MISPNVNRPVNGVFETNSDLKKLLRPLDAYNIVKMTSSLLITEPQILNLMSPSTQKFT